MYNQTMYAVYARTRNEPVRLVALFQTREDANTYGKEFVEGDVTSFDVIPQTLRLRKELT